MKVGDRVKYYQGRDVHAVATVVKNGDIDDITTECGEWAESYKGSGSDHILPPDTPVTCKRCLKVMGRGKT